MFYFPIGSYYTTAVYKFCNPADLDCSIFHDRAWDCNIIITHEISEAVIDLVGLRNDHFPSLMDHIITRNEKNKLVRAQGSEAGGTLG